MAPLEIQPRRGLDFINLGATLQNTLTALKSDTKRFPKVHLSFSSSQPLQTPIIVDLLKNGFRLRFDATTQRLCLIELVDISAGPFTYKGDLLLAPPSSSDISSLVYRRVYQLFGPSYPGEYVPTTSPSGQGSYILSFDGIAFTFPLAPSAYDANMDHAEMLSSSAAPVNSIAIFDASSWSEARKTLFISTMDHSVSTNTVDRVIDYAPISNFDHATVNLSDEKLFLTNRLGRSVTVHLGQTTAQDLVTDLGPPDTIFKRPGHIVDPPSATQRPDGSDKRRSSSGFAIHRPSYGSGPSSFSSTNTDTYDVEFDPDSAIDGPDVVRIQEQYYCYYRHGLDILLSPSGTAASNLSHTPTASRVVLHGNIPGSYSFNHHQRIQWSIADSDINSESLFSSVHEQLSTKLKGIWPDKDIKAGMVIVRDWVADSPGGSAILVENDSEEDEDRDNAEQWLKNTRLYKFPGLMAEVMHNDAICALTVYASQTGPD